MPGSDNFSTPVSPASPASPMSPETPESSATQESATLENSSVSESEQQTHKRRKLNPVHNTTTTFANTSTNTQLIVTASKSVQTSDHAQKSMKVEIPAARPRGPLVCTSVKEVEVGEDLLNLVSNLQRASLFFGGDDNVSKVRFVKVVKSYPWAVTVLRAITELLLNFQGLEANNFSFANLEEVRHASGSGGFPLQAESRVPSSGKKALEEHVRLCAPRMGQAEAGNSLTKLFEAVMKGTPSTDVSSVTAAPSVVSLPVVTEDIQPEVNTGVGSASTNDAILPTPGVDQLVEWLGGQSPVFPPDPEELPPTYVGIRGENGDGENESAAVSEERDTEVEASVPSSPCMFDVTFSEYEWGVIRNPLL